MVTMPISIRMPISTGIDSALPVRISAAATPPMASGSENRMVKGWITVLEQQDQHRQHQHQAHHHRVAEAGRSAPACTSASPAGTSARPGRSAVAPPRQARGGGVERHAERQVGADGGDALAVQAFDRGRPLGHRDVGHGGQGHGGAGRGR